MIEELLRSLNPLLSDVGDIWRNTVQNIEESKDSIYGLVILTLI